MHYKYLLFILLSLGLFTHAKSQNRYDLNSPLTRQGIGELHRTQPVRNLGMGGVGIANGHYEYINLQNPALLTNRIGLLLDSTIKYTKFEASLYNTNRQYIGPEGSFLTSTINFNSFSYLFPVGNRWATAISLNPYSSVSYNLHQQPNFVGDRLAGYSTQRGTGGLFEARFSNAYVLSKNLSLGLEASYIFGRITHENYFADYIVTIGTPPNITTTTIKVGDISQSSFRGFKVNPGIHYKGIISKSHAADSIVFMNIGLAYDYFGDMNSNNTLRRQARFTNEAIYANSDSILSTTRVDYQFPSSYKAGISFERPARWNIGADFTYTPWSTLTTFNTTDALSDLFKVALGGEIFRPSKSGGYLKGRTYRTGVSYSKGMLTHRGTDIHDISLSLGTTFPIGSKDAVDKLRPLSKINLALVAGQRGTFETGGVRERYINLYASFLINDRWFRRRRIN